MVEVRRADYHACDAANPIATYSSPSGNDYIKIERHGHYFFICGCVDHCALTTQTGDIRVPKALSVINKAPPADLHSCCLVNTTYNSCQ